MRPLPFGVRAHFDIFLVLVYAVNKEKAEALLPPPLIHETHNGKALMAVAFVKADKFRPSFFPSLFSMSFNLAGFRHMAKYVTTAGKTIRGLKIIRSATNKKIMVSGGDELTQYKFQYNPVVIEERNGVIHVKGNNIDIAVQESDGSEMPLPEGSVFESWTAARKYGGPLLYTFEINTNEISITEGSRKLWQPKPAKVLKAQTDFFDYPPYNDLEPVLSAAYVVKNIPYSWKKAVKEKI